jgi:hypothetical protein
MRLHASRKRFWDRPLRSCASPLLLRSLFDVGGQESVSPHQVDAEVGPLIPSATSSGQTTSKRSNTVRISSSVSNRSRVACRAK